MKPVSYTIFLFQLLVQLCFRYSFSDSLLGMELPFIIAQRVDRLFELLFDKVRLGWLHLCFICAHQRIVNDLTYTFTTVEQGLG